MIPSSSLPPPPPPRPCSRSRPRPHFLISVSLSLVWVRAPPKLSPFNHSSSLTHHILIIRPQQFLTISIVYHLLSTFGLIYLISVSVIDVDKYCIEHTHYVTVPRPRANPRCKYFSWIPTQSSDQRASVYF